MSLIDITTGEHAGFHLEPWWQRNKASSPSSSWRCLDVTKTYFSYENLLIKCIIWVAFCNFFGSLYVISLFCQSPVTADFSDGKSALDFARKLSRQMNSKILNHHQITTTKYKDPNVSAYIVIIQLRTMSIKWTLRYPTHIAPCFLLL